MANGYDRAWAAGLFEGEGSITWHTRNTKPGVRLTLKMTDEDTVRRFASIAGEGQVYGPYTDKGRPHQKPHWEWAAVRASARRVAEWLIPLLGPRRRARWEEINGA